MTTEHRYTLPWRAWLQNPVIQFCGGLVMLTLVARMLGQYLPAHGQLMLMTYVVALLVSGIIAFSSVERPRWWLVWLLSTFVWESAWLALCLWSLAQIATG